jgi:RNA polymerase sigma-70 factor (ECF subfamily)
MKTGLFLPNHSKEQKFKWIYEEYYAPFCLYAKRFIDDKGTREDIVSDVFTSLWNKMDSSDLNMDTLLGYIKMSIKNSCLNHLKHQEYEWDYLEMMQKRAPVYETEPDSVYNLKELYQMLYDTLDKLPENYRTVFVESFFNEKTYAEIAEEMNLSVKSVNRYKQKTIELLRLSLKDYFPLIVLLLTWSRSS